MKTIIKNLRIAFPEKSIFEIKLLALKSVLFFINNLMLWMKLDKITKEKLESILSFEPSKQEICEWTKQRPLILFTGHVGNWELANLAGEFYASPYGVIVKEQKGLIAKWLAAKRTTRNITLWVAGKDEKSIMRQIRYKSIGIVIDHGAKNGIKVKFFSKGCYFPRGLLWFAKKFKAAILPCFIVKKSKSLLCLKVLEPYLIKDTDTDEFLAMKFTKTLEHIVKEYPEQYLWTFKRWKYSWQIKVCILMDGRTGHIRQSQALVEYLRKAYPSKQIDVVEIDLKGIENKAVRLLISILPFLPLEIGERIITNFLSDKKKDLLDKYYDLIVSTGSSLVGLNIFLKKYNLAKNVVIMNPGRFCKDCFDLLIAPEHDNLKGRNVCTILGALSFFDLDLALKTAKKLEIPKSKVAVLLGGPIVGYPMEQRDILILLSELRCLGKDVIITTSRRTPNWIEDWLLKHRNEFSYVVIASQNNPANLVPAFFARAKRVISTVDSVSMISEAIYAGKIVGVWMGNNNRLRGKHKIFIDSLVKKNLVIKLSTKEDLVKFLSDEKNSNCDERGAEICFDLTQKLRSNLEL